MPWASPEQPSHSGLTLSPALDRESRGRAKGHLFISGTPELSTDGLGTELTSYRVSEGMAVDTSGTQRVHRWSFLLPLLVSSQLLTPLSLLQHFFTSFGARDRCFLLIFRLWQNALLEKVGLGESWTRGLEAGRGWGGTMEPGILGLGGPLQLFSMSSSSHCTCSFSIGRPHCPEGLRRLQCHSPPTRNAYPRLLGNHL